MVGPVISGASAVWEEFDHADADHPPRQPEDRFAHHAPADLNRALYSPIAGLLAVAATIPRDRYEVVLTDENIETVDFDLKADLVGISAMTSYVNRGYEIADAFRARGIPVIMGGVHPSFMPQEALEHCDAVVIGEAELVIPKMLDDLEQGQLRGIYRADKLHPMVGMPMPRYDLREEAPLRQPDLRADLARLPPGLHVLRRAADERPEVPLPPGRRGRCARSTTAARA